MKFPEDKNNNTQQQRRNIMEKKFKIDKMNNFGDPLQGGTYEKTGLKRPVKEAFDFSEEIIEVAKINKNGNFSNSETATIKIRIRDYYNTDLVEIGISLQNDHRVNTPFIYRVTGDKRAFCEFFCDTPYDCL